MSLLLCPDMPYCCVWLI